MFAVTPVMHFYLMPPGCLVVRQYHSYITIRTSCLRKRRTNTIPSDRSCKSLVRDKIRQKSYLTDTWDSLGPPRALRLSLLLLLLLLLLSSSLWLVIVIIVISRYYCWYRLQSRQKFWTRGPLQRYIIINDT